MGLTRRSVVLAAATSLLAAPLLRAAVSPADTPPADSGAYLTGQLLVAGPDMFDPRFSNTVILAVRHNAEGAFGIVINRPVEERSIESLAHALGDKEAHLEGSLQIFAGGPVEQRLGFILHSAEYHLAETLIIDNRFALTSNLDVLRDIAHHRGPAKSLMAFGYAGWGPGQLESEIAQRAWFIAPADPTLVFDEDREKVWETAMARRVINL